jgi:hypothetical protein
MSGAGVIAKIEFEALSAGTARASVSDIAMSEFG